MDGLAPEAVRLGRRRRPILDGATGAREPRAECGLAVADRYSYDRWHLGSPPLWWGMRIAHVITKGDVGGAQTHVVELAGAQASRRDSVIVVAGSDGPAVERRALAASTSRSSRRWLRWVGTWRLWPGRFRELRAAIPRSPRISFTGTRRPRG